MLRRRWKMLARIGLILALPISCAVFLYSVCSPPGPSPPPTLFERPIESGHSAELAFSPDGKWLAFPDGAAVYLCNIQDGFSARKINNSIDNVLDHIAFTHDSRSILVSGLSDKLQRLDVESATFQASISFPGSWINGIAASPVDNHVAVVVTSKVPRRDSEPTPKEGLILFHLDKPDDQHTLSSADHRSPV